MQVDSPAEGGPTLSRDEIHLYIQRLYNFQVGEWGSCQRNYGPLPCGTGLQARAAYCVKTSDIPGAVAERVDYSKCLQAGLPPPATSRTCFTACSFMFWDVGPWSECSSACGGGYQTRTVRCRDETQFLVDDQCLRNGLEKPDTQQICNAYPCNARWYVGPWEECTRVCGTGYRTRRVACLDIYGRQLDWSQCRASARLPFHGEEVLQIAGNTPLRLGLEKFGLLETYGTVSNSSDEVFQTTIRDTYYNIEFKLFDGVPAVQEPCNAVSCSANEFRYTPQPWKACTNDCTNNTVEALALAHSIFQTLWEEIVSPTAIRYSSNSTFAYQRQLQTNEEEEETEVVVPLPNKQLTMADLLDGYLTFLSEAEAAAALQGLPLTPEGAAVLATMPAASRIPSFMSLLSEPRMLDTKILSRSAIARTYSTLYSAPTVIRTAHPYRVRDLHCTHRSIGRVPLWVCDRLAAGLPVDMGTVQALDAETTLEEIEAWQGVQLSAAARAYPEDPTAVIDTEFPETTDLTVLRPTVPSLPWASTPRLQRPETMKLCNTELCHARQLLEGPWSECDTGCGLGMQTRKLFCIDRDPDSVTRALEAALAEQEEEPEVPVVNDDFNPLDPDAGQEEEPLSEDEQVKGFLESIGIYNTTVLPLSHCILTAERLVTNRELFSGNIVPIPETKALAIVAGLLESFYSLPAERRPCSSTRLCPTCVTNPQCYEFSKKATNGEIPGVTPSGIWRNERVECVEGQCVCRRGWSGPKCDRTGLIPIGAGGGDVPALLLSLWNNELFDDYAQRREDRKNQLELVPTLNIPPIPEPEYAPIPNAPSNVDVFASLESRYAVAATLETPERLDDLMEYIGDATAAQGGLSFIEQPVTCTGGRRDAFGHCCRNIIDPSGMCCEEGSSVDIAGECCPPPYTVDSCGRCGGDAVAVGECCFPL